MDFLKQIVKENLVSEEEDLTIKNEISKVIKAIVQHCKSHNIEASVMLGGSSAKGTFIKGDFDVDIFVRFDQKYKESELSNILEKVISGFKPVRVHGSRDYFQFSSNGISYEVVPVYYVENYKEAKNVTDMSPLHVLWINKKLNEEIKKNIILTKIFCKANSLYGAESHIKGFSGHVIDILVIYYGSFINLLKEAINWNIHQVVDVENYKTADKLNESKISPLIVIDPIQPDRNAAAALSEEKFLDFKRLANDFMKNPSKNFFIKEPLNIQKVKDNYSDCDIIDLNITPLEGKDDVIGSKVIKALQYIVKQLGLFGFTVIENDWEFGKNIRAYIVVEKEILSETREHLGPPIKEKEACKIFKEKHNEVIKRDNRLYAIIKRDIRTIEEAMKLLIKDKYVYEKVLKIKWEKLE